MKNKINEPDFIGGQGSLTKKEEMELRKYFAEKKKRMSQKKKNKSTKVNKDSTLSS